MRENRTINKFFRQNEYFRQVLAGKITIDKYFSQEQFKESKKEFMSIFSKEFGNRPSDSLYSDENVAAAWITKLRYNEKLTDQQFLTYINQSELIFKGEMTRYNLTANTPENNDLCAIMWGIEALNGIQSFDRGATRVRLPPGVAPQIMTALENANAKPRESTHAQCTRLVNKGLGKDIQDETLREYTPRGMGNILIIPTAQDGKGKTADTIAQIPNVDYDLVMKREKYGYKDTNLHTAKHLGLGFVNKIINREQFKEGKHLIEKKSPLAMSAEAEFGSFKRVNRKEHLVELKKESKVLLDLFIAGSKDGLFTDFKTSWVFRMKLPPWEIKIVSQDSNNRQGLGEFINQLAQAKKSHPGFATANEEKLESVRGLLVQATEIIDGDFKRCREGNEVLVNCKSGKACLIDPIAKNTNDAPLNRSSLIPLGMVSEVNPELALSSQNNMKNSVIQNRNTQNEEGLENIESPSKPFS